MSIFKRKEEKVNVKRSVDFYNESKQQLIGTINRMTKCMDIDITQMLNLDEKSGQLLGICCEYVRNSDQLMKEACEAEDRRQDELDKKFDSINEQLMKQNTQLQAIMIALQKK